MITKTPTEVTLETLDKQTVKAIMLSQDWDAGTITCVISISELKAMHFGDMPESAAISDKKKELIKRMSTY